MPFRDDPHDMQHGEQGEESAGGDKVRFHRVSIDRCVCRTRQGCDEDE